MTSDSPTRQQLLSGVALASCQTQPAEADPRIDTVFVDRIVRPRECSAMVGFHDVHIRRLEARHVFPPRFKLAPDSGPYGATGWMLSWIVKYLKERAATAGHEPEGVA